MPHRANPDCSRPMVSLPTEAMRDMRCHVRSRALIRTAEAFAKSGDVLKAVSVGLVAAAKSRSLLSASCRGACAGCRSGDEILQCNRYPKRCSESRLRFAPAGQRRPNAAFSESIKVALSALPPDRSESINESLRITLWPPPWPLLWTTRRHTLICPFSKTGTPSI